MLALLGCDPGSKLGDLVLDYHIDRPRVVGIRAVPPVVVVDEPVTLEALALVPLGQQVEALTARSCETHALAQTVYQDLACIEEPDLTVDLGDVPFTRAFSLPRCADVIDTAEPCASQLPVVVTATSAGEEGHGHVFLEVGLRSRPVQQLLSESDQSLEVTGGTVAAGGEVELTYRLQGGGRHATVRWYVDGGVLEGTGETTVVAVEDGFSVSTNRLRIPARWKGPFRVVVSVGAAPHMGAADGAWTVLTLEVP